jgi:hypothetical protein
MQRAPLLVRDEKTGTHKEILLFTKPLLEA